MRIGNILSESTFVLRFNCFLGRFNVFKAENIQRSLFPKDETDKNVDYKNFIDLNLGSDFSFSRFCDWSPQEMEDFHLKSTFYALLKQISNQKTLAWLQYAQTWDYPIPTKYWFLSASISLSLISLMESHHNLFFTRWVNSIDNISYIDLLIPFIF